MTSFSRRASAAIAALLLIQPAILHAAEQAGSNPGPMVQQVPESDDLARYLTRLAKDPRDTDSLIGAGEAALRLNDPRAAAEFFARADAIRPTDKRVKAGLGRAMLGMENPREALRLFAEAVRLGAKEVEIASDRGLAFDLIGDPASAQRDYKIALDRDSDDPEVLRRYAVSLGISGKWQEADRIVDPLLRKSDKSAWRNRAFILAMNGQSKQARDITQVMMPKNMAEAIQPFMDRMPALSPSQKAAAVHFGHFPSGLVQSARPAMVQPLPAQGKSRVVQPPAGSRAARSAPPARSAAAPTTPPQPVQPPPRSGLQPTSTQPQRPVPQQQPVRTVAAPVETAPLPARSSVLPAAAAPVADTIGPPAQPDSSGRLVASAPAASQQQDSRSLAEIMRSVNVPDAERAPAMASVDLAEVARIQAEKRKAQQAAAARAKAEAEAKAKAKAEAEAKAKAKAEAELKARNPARIWVQIATGRDEKALAFDMARLRKKHADLLKGKEAWTSQWGATKRMVIGPFASTAAARNFYSDWMKAGGDGYIWQSTDGLEVVKLLEK